MDGARLNMCLPMRTSVLVGYCDAASTFLIGWALGENR